MQNSSYEVSMDGVRLDVYLTDILEDKSRSFIQNIIEDGNVLVNGILKKSNYKVKKGDIIDVSIEEPKELTIVPQPISLHILYEDSDLIVVNKPQGMVVHPASGIYKDTLVNALLYHCKDLSGINGILRPGIVHRIDKDTSGILVVAKNDYAHIKLSEQLKEHSMKREYIALAEGVIKEDEGIVDKPLARDPVQRIKIAVSSSGRRAVTHFRVLKRYDNYTLIKCILETGRTHQIRVHMAYIRHPLVGDPVYGYKKQKFNLNGQMLHAEILGFIHPRTGEYMEFQVDPPEHFKEIISILDKRLI